MSMRHTAILCLAVPWRLVTPCEVRAQIEETFVTGSAWTLRVNADRATLQLLEGKGERTADRGFKLEYEVTWGGRPGVLRAERDRTSAIQRVWLRLTDATGARVECQGFVGQGSAEVMAGSCKERRGPGAWYAVRSSADSLAAPAAQASGETKPAAMTGYLGSLDGLYHAGKSDQTQPLAFPSPQPGNNDLNNWLQAHNGALLEVLKRLYSASDISSFRAAEHARCQKGGVYCEIGFRQQAIGFALQPTR